MKREDAVNFVVQALGKHEDRNEIIVALCQQTGMNWAQAEQFVKQVEVDHKSTITSRQTPLFIVMGITFIVIGCGLLIANVQFFTTILQSDPSEIALAVRGAYFRIGSVVTGFAMVIGGMMGLWRAVSDLNDKNR